MLAGATDCYIKGTMLTSLSSLKKPFLAKRIGFLALLAALIVLLSPMVWAQTPQLRWIEQNFSVFNGIPARVLLGLPKAQATPEKQDELKKSIDAIFADIDKRFNAYNPQSDLGRLNASLQPAVTVDAGFGRELREVWDVARDVAQASDGAFDPTIWPFKKLWQDAQKTQVLPSALQLAQAAKTVGYQKIVLSAETQVERPIGTMLDLGGVVKGYGVDRIVKMLREKGISNGLVQIGGEIRVFGVPESGVWRLGVQDPLDMNKLFGVIAPKGEASVSTSGNYRQPIEIGGTTYYHIFNPQTGQPISTELLGVTVLYSGSSTLPNTFADAFTKTLAVGGVEKGMALAKQKGVEVLVILRGATPGSAPRVVQSEGFMRVFTRSSDH